MTRPTDAHPPGLTPVLQVGLIGHITLAPEALAPLREAARAVLCDLREAALASCPGQAPVLRCVTGLAAGADALLSDVAVPLGYELSALLPLHRDEYRADFTTDAARAQFDRQLAAARTVYQRDGTRAGAQAYQALGHLLVEQSDILVAIWNGDPERGPGGTGDVLQQAWLADLPAITIGSTSPYAVRVWDPASGTGESVIATLVDRLLRFRPEPGKPDELALYLAETVPARATGSRLLAGLETALLAGATPGRPAAPAVPEPAEGPQGAGPQDAPLAAAEAQVAAVLGPHFEAADRLAVRYGNLYRISGALRYLAVIPAAIGSLLADYAPTRYAPIGTVLQAASFIGVLAIFAVDYVTEWHRRFLDYRFLAEHLRSSMTVALFGAAAARPGLPSHLSDTAPDWLAFRLRATVRALGLITACQDGAYTAALRARLLRDIGAQIGFFGARGERYRALARRLQWIGVALFAAGLMFTLVRFGLGFAHHRSLTYSVAAVLSSALPALAPVFFGLRSQAEYNRLSQRYLSMLAQLRRIGDDLASDDVRRNRVERMARETQAVLLSEVTDWRVLIKGHDLTPF